MVHVQQCVEEDSRLHQGNFAPYVEKVSKTNLSETAVEFEYQWLAQQGVPGVVH
jgi:hypothetical protein